MTEKFVKQVSERYIELFENITGDKFIRSDSADVKMRIKSNIDNFISRKM